MHVASVFVCTLCSFICLWCIQLVTFSSSCTSLYSFPYNCSFFSSRWVPTSCHPICFGCSVSRMSAWLVSQGLWRVVSVLQSCWLAYEAILLNKKETNFKVQSPIDHGNEEDFRRFEGFRAVSLDRCIITHCKSIIRKIQINSIIMNNGYTFLLC